MYNSLLGHSMEDITNYAPIKHPLIESAPCCVLFFVAQ